MLARLPRLLLRLEGLVLFLAALALYFDTGFGVVALVVLALAPDLSFFAYLGGPRLGAAVYDAVHTYVGPILLASAGVLTEWDPGTQLGLIWLAHCGIDRALGYGLKYPTAFKDTHLQRV